MKVRRRERVGHRVTMHTATTTIIIVIVIIVITITVAVLLLYIDRGRSLGPRGGARVDY